MNVRVKRYRLIIEAHGVDQRVHTIPWVYDFLETLSRVIFMRIFVPPIVARIPVACAAERIYTDSDCGVSGMVMWLESGAQIHTWPEDEFLALDLFSCKEFSIADAVRFVRQETQPRELVVWDPTRGPCIYSERIGEVPVFAPQQPHVPE